MLESAETGRTPVRRFVDDPLDCARASTALRATAQAGIELAHARTVRDGFHGGPNLVVAEHIA
jgi:hypothetical protein